MDTLSRAVLDLVTAATADADPRALRRVVEPVLDAFDDAPKAARDGAVRAMGKALESAEGRGAQVLCLALGALVEGGASPELAWRAVGRGLGALLDDATAFASAAVERADEPHLDVAIEAVGGDVAETHPREARAFRALPSRCLAAIACITRSKKVRSRRDDALVEATWALSEAVPEVGHLRQALQIVDDTELVVLAPDLRRGWRVALDEVASNAELYVLLGDALIGPSDEGGIPGKRPDPRAVGLLRGEAGPKPRARSVALPFQLVTPPGHAADGAPDEVGSEEVISPEGDLTEVFGGGREHVVILTSAASTRAPLARAFEGTSPSLTVVATLSPAEVDRALKRLARPSPPKRATKRASQKG